MKDEGKGIHFIIRANADNFFIGILFIAVFYCGQVNAKQDVKPTLVKGENYHVTIDLIDYLFEIARLHKKQLIIEGKVEDIKVTPTSRQVTLIKKLSHVLRGTNYTFSLKEEDQLIVIIPKAVSKANVSNEPYVTGWERILVTGQSNRNRSILESSISVSHLDQDKINQGLTFSTAELLTNIPGFWVESSGGEANNNVAPRGLRGGEGFRFISVMEDGLPVVYDGIWADFFLRIDTTVKRVETVRSGSSGLLTTNGPAAMVNFISHKGISNEKNLAKLSFGTNYSYLRFDGLSSGALTEFPGWYYSFGGYYRQSDGIRNPGFVGDQGGQIKLSLSQLAEHSELTLSLKHLDDRTIFYTPIPMTDSADPKGIKGVDANYGTLLSRDFNDLKFENANGQQQPYSYHSIDDGQQTNLTALYFSYDWSRSDSILISNKSRWSELKNSMFTLVNLGNETITSATDRLTQSDIQNFILDNKEQGALFPAYQYVTSGNIVTRPDKLNSNGLITNAYPLYAIYKQKQWVNHLSANFESEWVQLSLGHILAISQFTDLPFDQWQGQIITDVIDQSKRIDIVALDKHGEVVSRFSNDGFEPFNAPARIAGGGAAKSHSVYANLSFNPIPELFLDVGVRRELLNLESTVEKAISDSDLVVSKPLTTHSRLQTFDELAWSIGANYVVNKDLATFINISKAFEMPRLLNFGNEVSWQQDSEVVSGASFGEAVNLFFYEWGLRYANDNWQVATTLFETQFDPLPFSVYRGNYSNEENIFIDTNTIGMEFEARLNWHENLDFEFIGVAQSAQIEGIPNQFPEYIYNGNRITRTPNFQFKFATKYRYRDLTTLLTLSHIGKRYSDIANSFKLHSYSTMNLLMSYQVNNFTSVNLIINNLTNSIGLTEGNPRSGLVHDDSNVFYARPILGRSAKLSVEFSF